MVYLAPHLGIESYFYLLIPFVSNNLYMNCIIYNHNSDQIELFSFSFGLIPLVAGVGGKLSRAVYLAPTWVYNYFLYLFLMLIQLVSNFLYRKLYHL